MQAKSRTIRIIGVLIIVELYLQVFSFARFGWGVFVKKRSENDTIARTWAFQNTEFRLVYGEESSIKEEYYPFLGWRMRELHTPHINVNAQGIRTTVGNPATTADMPRVYFFGGSAMWGEGVSDENTIPSLVSQAVNSERPFAEITNFGELGYGYTQEILRLVLLLKSGKIPDYVVFYDGCNDLYSAILDTTPHLTLHDASMKARLGNIWELSDGTHKQASSANPSIFSVAFLRKIAHGIATYVQIIRYPLMWYSTFTRQDETVKEAAAPSFSDTDRYVDGIVKNYLGNTRILEALAKQYKFDYLLIWQPTVYSRTLTKEEANLPDLRKEHYDELSTIYRRAGNTLTGSGIHNYVDLSRMFDGIKEDLYTDTCHVTSKGNTIIRNVIMQQIDLLWKIK